MIALVFGFPVFALGIAAIWSRSRRPKLAIVDLIDEAPKSKRHKRNPKTKVDAVVLHQMGFSRGNDPLRYAKVTAHFIVLADGTVAQLHPLNARLSASDGFNSRSVSVEFAGNFQSINGKWWKPDAYGVDYPTSAQLEAGRELLRMLRAIGITHVFAHRQSSGSRGNDPGPEVWRAVGQWGIEQLGLVDGGPGYAINDGHPVPDEWRRPPALS